LNFGSGMFTDGSNNSLKFRDSPYRDNNEAFPYDSRSGDLTFRYVKIHLNNVAVAEDGFVSKKQAAGVRAGDEVISNQDIHLTQTKRPKKMEDAKKDKGCANQDRQELVKQRVVA